MIGDITLLLRKVLHQQMICVHQYKTKVSKDLKGVLYKKCEKCGRIKE